MGDFCFYRNAGAYAGKFFEFLDVADADGDKGWTKHVRELPKKIALV